MKFLFEFLPILLFFVVFKVKGIYFATAAAIAVSIFQILFAYIRTRKIEPVMWISLIVLIVFGGSTLLLKNELFIKWKPTVLYWIFSIALAVSNYIFKKNLIQAMLKKQVELPENVWQKLNLSWIYFFTVLGFVNLFVAYKYSTAVWVNFKLFGILGCMLVFVVFQSIFLSQYIDKKPE